MATSTDAIDTGSDAQTTAQTTGTWPHCCDVNWLDWDDEQEITQPDLARLDASAARDAQGFAMLHAAGDEHPDVPIPYRLTTKGAHHDLATLDPIGMVP